MGHLTQNQPDRKSSKILFTASPMQVLRSITNIFGIFVSEWFLHEMGRMCLARYNEPGVNFGFENFILHCYQVRPHSSVLR